MEVWLLEHAGRRYALDASWVSGVADPVPVALLPFAPPWVEGMAAIGDQIVAQIDFGRRLGLAATTGAGTLLLVRQGHESLAVRLDRVLSRLELPPGIFVAYTGNGDTAFIDGEFVWEGQTVLHIATPAFLFARARTGRRTRRRPGRIPGS